MKFLGKALLAPVAVGVGTAIIIQLIGLGTGNPDLLLEVLGKVDILLDKLIALVDRCENECFE